MWRAAYCEIRPVSRREGRLSSAAASGTRVAPSPIDPMSSESLLANDDVLSRVKGEFLEMPGLRLTEPQARRLWGLDAASCGALLTALVDAQFLFRTRDGAFMRLEHATLVHVPGPHPRKNVAAA